MPDTKEAQAYQSKIGSPFRESRYAANLKYAPIEKWIWRDQVCYQTIRQDSTNLVTIDSSAIAEAERAAFEVIWGTIK